MTLLRVCLCLLAVAGLGHSLPAQVRPRPNIPFLTASLGLGAASGAGFIQRNTLDLDVAAGMLFHNRRLYSLIAGGFAGATGTMSGSSFPCTTDPNLCPTFTPTVEYTGVMFGIESSPLERATAIGFALGPTLLQTSRILGADDSGGKAARFGGLHVRIEGVRRLRPKLRLVFAVRTMVIPSYAGRRLTLSTFGVGLRFQTFQPFN